jgi:hypothetical protein
MKMRHTASLDVTAEWLALLLPILKAPGWILGPGTAGYSYWDIAFFSVRPGKFGDDTLKQTKIASSISVQFIIYQ